MKSKLIFKVFRNGNECGFVIQIKLVCTDKLRQILTAQLTREKQIPPCLRQEYIVYVKPIRLKDYNLGKHNDEDG